MSNIIPFEGGQVPAILKDLMNGTSDELGAGIGSGGFAVVSFRASKWRVKYQGEEYPILNSDGDPVSSLEAVVLKANGHVSKNYYAKGYTEGATDAPDCFSLDGIAPDRSVQSPVNDKCASCPKNVFGSRMTEAGKKAKACADNKRLAVVPLYDIENKFFGGPMLLRVPAASLADLRVFAQTISSKGYPYYAVAVRLGFDLEASYPKLTFKAMRLLTNEEAQVVFQHHHADVTERILAEAVEIRSPAEEAEAVPDGVLESMAPVESIVARPQQTQVAPRPAAPKPASAAAPKPASKAPAAGPPRAPAPVARTAVPATPKLAAKARPPAAAPRPAPVAATPVQQEVVADEAEAAGGEVDLDSEIKDILAGLDTLSN